MYHCPIIANNRWEGRVLDDHSTNIHKNTARCHNWGAVPPNLSLSDCQISDMNGIVGSHDYTLLGAHSMINKGCSFLLIIVFGKRRGRWGNPHELLLKDVLNVSIVFKNPFLFNIHMCRRTWVHTLHIYNKSTKVQTLCTICQCCECEISIVVQSLQLHYANYWAGAARGIVVTYTP